MAVDADERKLLQKACMQAEGALLRIVGVLRDPGVDGAERARLEAMAEALEHACQHLFDLCKEPSRSAPGALGLEATERRAEVADLRGTTLRSAA